MSDNIASTATNIAAPNLAGSKDNPNKFFNNYFSVKFEIGPANDALIAYLEKFTGNESAGKTLAAAVLYTAQAQNINPMTVLNQFQKLKPGELNSYLAAMLNFNRVPTSMLGIKTKNNVNQYIERSIIP